MGGRQGGKAKPLKAPKKATKEVDEDDVAFREKQKREAAERKALADKLKGGDKLGAGLKKSSGKAK